MLAVVALLANALVWGVSWIGFRWIDARGLDTLWTTAIAYLIATAALAAVRPRAPALFARSPWLWLLAFGAGLTNACFNWAVTVGEVVRVVLLFYLMPVWMLVLARVLLGERAGALGWLRVALALAGAALVLARPEGGVPLPVSVADWMGVAGGMGFALTNVLLRRQASDAPEARALAMFVGGVVLAGAAAAVATALAPARFAPDPAMRWLPGVLAMCVALGGANFALQFGAARLPSSVTAVVMLSEIVFATLSAVLWGGESLTLSRLAGAALILGAALLAALGAAAPAGGAPARARSGREARP